jgi:uncharacterized protein (TIGR02186 family)
MIPAASPPPAVQAQAAVSAALTETNVQVNSGFRGARIVLYGAVFDPLDRPSDVVVIVRGPEQPVRIARKTRILGLWMNSRPVVFQGAPGFYIAASSRPLDEIAGFAELRRLGAGVDHLAIHAPAEQRVETRYGIRDMVVSRLGSDYLDWRRAVVRLKEKGGLYAVDERGVRFVDKGLFRAEIALPAEPRSASIRLASCSSRRAGRCPRSCARSRSPRSAPSVDFTFGLITGHGPMV